MERSSLTTQAQRVKNLPAIQETWVQSVGQEDPLEKGMATHSSILAWRIPWTEEPGGLGCSPWSSKKVDTTELLTHVSLTTLLTDLVSPSYVMYIQRFWGLDVESLVAVFLVDGWVRSTLISWWEDYSEQYSGWAGSIKITRFSKMAILERCFYWKRRRMGNPWIHFWLKEWNNESWVYGKVIRKQSIRCFRKKRVWRQQNHQGRKCEEIRVLGISV